MVLVGIPNLPVADLVALLRPMLSERNCRSIKIYDNNDKSDNVASHKIVKRFYLLNLYTSIIFPLQPCFILNLSWAFQVLTGLDIRKYLTQVMP
ncbi:MAG: hypothetical protein DRH90_01530 [Deltaproteobacteria bacterium]|nr:MAG: hypothetical protein DRH90_01530 [Deltaproteobacteria bacterium]